MKRTLAATLVLFCAVAVSPLRGQTPSNAKNPLAEARQRFLDVESRVGFVLRDSVVEGFLNPSDASTDQRQAMRDKLRPVLEESFDARQRLQHAELEALRRRLAEIEQAIAAREKSKAAIVDARLESLFLSMNGTAATAPGAYTYEVREEQYSENGQLKKRQVPVVVRRTTRVPGGQLPEEGRSGVVLPPSLPASGEPPREIPEAGTKEQNETASEAQFDFETRERLAQIDLLEAEEQYDAEEKQLKQARRLHETGAMSESGLATFEKNLRRARADRDRAKVKVEGLARLREAAAKAAVAEAEGERDMAVGIVRAKENNQVGAQASLQKAEADLKAATAKRDHHSKDYQRVQNLADTGAADASLVEDRKDKLAGAEAEWAAARSAVNAAKAYVKDTEAQLEEARTAVPVAEAKLREAQTQLDRLLRRSAPAVPPEADSKPVKENQP